MYQTIYIYIYIYKFCRILSGLNQLNSVKELKDKVYAT